MDLWSRFRDGLARTRAALGGEVGVLLGLKGSVDAPTIERLEEALLAADVGPATTERLIERAVARMGRAPDLDLRGALEGCAAELLGERMAPFEPAGEPRGWP